MYVQVLKSKCHNLSHVGLNISGDHIQVMGTQYCCARYGTKLRSNYVDLILSHKLGCSEEIELDRKRGKHELQRLFIKMYVSGSVEGRNQIRCVLVKIRSLMKC